jgi:hypothetical protein
MVVAQGGRKRSFRSTAVTPVSALVIPEYLLYLWASRAVMVQSAGDGPARQNGQSPAPKSVVAIYQIWDFCEADSWHRVASQPRGGVMRRPMQRRLSRRHGIALIGLLVRDGVWRARDERIGSLS